MCFIYAAKSLGIENGSTTLRFAVKAQGGMPGASTFRDCKILENMVKKHAEKGKLYAAVCAAPAVALGASGNLSSVMHEQTSFRGASCRIKGTD
ncbi:protein DJ-1B-like [Hordeum vulgare]|nr:protein DJ-1B-like [Hordeum vulgare]